MRRLSAVLQVLALVLAIAPARATARDAAADGDRKVKKAVELVDAALAAADGLRLLENRVRLRMAAANALWPADKERAAKVVARVARDVVAAIADIDLDTREGAERAQMLRGVRREIVGELAQRDPALALALLLETRAAAGWDAGAGGYDPDTALELQVAQMAADADPKRAVEVAEASLERGVNYNLASLLAELRRRDPAAAARVAAKVVARIKATRLASDQAAASIAVWLLADGIQVLGAPPEAGPGPLLTPELLRELADHIIASVLAVDTAGGSVQELAVTQQLFGQVEPVLEPLTRYAPASAEALLRKIAEAKDAFSRLYGPTMPNQYENATVDQLVEAAATAPEGMRDSLIFRAAESAASGGDADRARAIVRANVREPAMRAQMLENMDRQAFYTAMSAERFDEARRLIGRVGTPAERVGLLVQMALLTKKVDDMRVARGFLAEADQVAGERAADRAMFQARLGLAAAYADVDPARGFAIVESSVDQLNGLLEASAALDGFNCEPTFADGELVLYGGGGLAAFAVASCEAIAALGPADFERAAAAAGRFGRPEARALALVLVARSMLQGAQGER